MHDDITDQTIKTDDHGKAQNGPDRAGRLRERIRLSQTIAAQRARIEATGGKPSNDEAARMVSEFHARAQESPHPGLELGKKNESSGWCPVAGMHRAEPMMVLF